MSEKQTTVEAGIVSAKDVSIEVVISAPKSPSLLGATADALAANAAAVDTGADDAVSPTPPSLSDYTSVTKDAGVDSAAAAAEPEPAADTVDSDAAISVFAAHDPSASAVFWSKLARPTDPPTAPTDVTEDDPALEPVIKNDPAAKPVDGSGEPPPSIKEFPAETPAPADIADWTTPSNPRRNIGRKGEVKSTKVSNKYDPLDDVETNVDKDEDEKKGKEEGAESGKESSFESVSPESVGGTGKAPRDSTPSSTTNSGATVNPETTTTATPEGSVSASGWLSWPKFCWHNALCTVFICLITVSAGGGAFAYFSHVVSDSFLPSIVPDATALPTERGLLFAPFNPTPDPVVPDPPDVVNDPTWLIATTGFCSNLNVVMNERGIKNDDASGVDHFIADIEFNYYPQTAVKLTDFPYHKANTIEGDQNEADALASPTWDHKNIALLEPTSTCGVDEQSNQAWGISVFKVKDHRPCADGEAAWEGHPCVHYSGYVSAETSNFVNMNAGRFLCQLFVDSNRLALQDSVVVAVHGATHNNGECLDPLVDCNSGKFARFGVGRFVFDSQSWAPGKAPNDAVESISVADGYQATLFENANFGGWKQTYRLRGTVNYDLGEEMYRNSASSMVVTHDTETAPVVLYEDDNFEGIAIGLVVADYNLAALKNQGAKNDQVSSIEIKSGFKVTVYSDDNFDGKEVNLGAGKYTKVQLGDMGVGNDVVSSVTVHAASYQQPCPSCVVAVYDDTHNNGECLDPLVDCNSGKFARFGVGRFVFDSQSWAPGKAPNDAVESISVADGYQATLFENANFGGWKQTYRLRGTVNYDLGEEMYRNSASSMVVTHDTETAPVVLYEDDNFEGIAIGLVVADYNLAALKNQGAKNDQVSSIEIKSGFKVTVYSDDNFDGKEFNLGAGKYTKGQLGDMGVGNDVVSSVKVNAGSVFGGSGPIGGLPAGMCSSDSCDDEEFCNHDNGRYGSCEPCPENGVCSGMGLPGEGVEDCSRNCLPGPVCQREAGTPFCALPTPKTTLKLAPCSTGESHGLSPRQVDALLGANLTKCAFGGPLSVLVASTARYPDSYLLTASMIIHELIDADSDGQPDDQLVYDRLSYVLNKKDAPLLAGGVTEAEERRADRIAWRYGFGAVYSLQTWKALPHEGSSKPIKIMTEESIHMYTAHGLGAAYPDAWSQRTWDSTACREMARVECITWWHPENECPHLGQHTPPELSGTCNGPSCDCTEWLNQVLQGLIGMENGWLSPLIPSTPAALRASCSKTFLDLVEKYQPLPSPLTYTYVV